MSTALAQGVFDTMWAKDFFSQWLGLQLESIASGHCIMTYKVRKEMLNGHQSIHGGVLFSASDSVFAFACNSNNELAVALDVSITFTKPAFEGDELRVEAIKIHHGKRIGLYEVKTYNAQKELICSFKGTCYTNGKSVIQKEENT